MINLPHKVTQLMKSPKQTTNLCEKSTVERLRNTEQWSEVQRSAVCLHSGTISYILDFSRLEVINRHSNLPLWTCSLNAADGQDLWIIKTISVSSPYSLQVLHNKIIRASYKTRSTLGYTFITKQLRYIVAFWNSRISALVAAYFMIKEVPATNPFVREDRACCLATCHFSTLPYLSYLLFWTGVTNRGDPGTISFGRAHSTQFTSFTPAFFPSWSAVHRRVIQYSRLSEGKCHGCPCGINTRKSPHFWILFSMKTSLYSALEIDRSLPRI